MHDSQLTSWQLSTQRVVVQTSLRPGSSTLSFGHCRFKQRLNCHRQRHLCLYVEGEASISTLQWCRFDAYDNVDCNGRNAGVLVYTLIVEVGSWACPECFGGLHPCGGAVNNSFVNSEYLTNNNAISRPILLFYRLITIALSRLVTETFA